MHSFRRMGFWRWGGRGRLPYPCRLRQNKTEWDGMGSNPPRNPRRRRCDVMSSPTTTDDFAGGVAPQLNRGCARGRNQRSKVCQLLPKIRFALLICSCRREGGGRREHVADKWAIHSRIPLRFPTSLLHLLPSTTC
jgi:hypothetical protein